MGVFLFLHIGTNSLIAVSTEASDLYQKQVNNLHSIGPLLIPVEILFIFLPLAFHAIVGVKIWAVKGDKYTICQPAYGRGPPPAARSASRNLRWAG